MSNISGVVTFTPNLQDVELYKQIIKGKAQKPYYKDFMCLHKFSEFSESTINIYNIIHNQVFLHKYNSDKILSKGKSSEERKKILAQPLSFYPTIINVNTFNSYGRIYSYNTIRKAISQLEEYNFIKVNINTKQKNSKEFVVLKDVEYVTIDELIGLKKFCDENGIDGSWIDECIKTNFGVVENKNNKNNKNNKINNSTTNMPNTPTKKKTGIGKSRSKNHSVVNPVVENSVENISMNTQNNQKNEQNSEDNNENNENNEDDNFLF